MVEREETKKSIPHKRRCVKRSSRKWVGIRLLSRSRQVMLDDNLYEAEVANAQAPVPFFINSIRSDGVQIKLILKTLARHHPTARHVNVLVKKGYSEIANTKDAKLDVFKDTRGVFDETQLKKISKEKQKLIKNNPQDVKFELHPNDPGVIEMVACGTAELFDDPNAFAQSSNFNAIKSSYYRMLNLSKNSCKVEEQKRRENQGYKLAIDSLSQERLNHNACDLVSYIKTRNSVSQDLEAELLSEDRSRLRFIRFRAQQRALSHVARMIAGRDSVAAELKSEKRMRAKAERQPDQADQINKRLEQREKLKIQLGRLRIRVVLFGNGIFSHGRPGPCPRKKLLKKLAEICIVILINEFRTSKMCCGSCGHEAKQLKGSRVLRCQSGKNHEGVAPSCALWNTLRDKPFEIDRDQNADVNIFRIGQGILLGNGRPAYLTRKQSDKENIDQVARETEQAIVVSVKSIPMKPQSG